MASDKDIKLDEGFEEVTDVSLDAGFEEVEVPTVKKKDVPAPKLESGSEATISSNGQSKSKSTSASTIVSKPNPNNQTSFTVSKENSFGIPNFQIPGVQKNTFNPLTEQQKAAGKKVLGEGTTVKETTQTPIETPQYDVSGATKQQSDNTDTRLVNVSQQAESKRVAQEAEKVKREQELANPNSFQNIGTSYKEKALKTTGNNDIEKMLNFGDINGNKAFVEATLDDNDKHVLGVIKEIEKINNDNKIYEQQLKSGAITQEIYDAHKKENTKKSIDLNAEYVKGIQSRNSAIDDEIKQSQTKLANGYDIKMLGAQPYSEPLTTQQIDEEKKKIKTLTDLKNDVLIDVNNPVKSLEKHEGFQNAEKEGLIPNGATNTQKVRIYSYILADKAKKLATELGYNPNDVKSLMGDKFGSNTPKMFWESAKSLIFGSNPKEKEFVHTMAELQAIAPISILNKNNLNLNEGYTSNIVSSFRKSVAPMFPRNQIATDQDRNALTQEAFNQAGVNQDVNSAYTTQQGNVDKESKTIGKTVSRTAGDIFGIGVKVAGINTLLGIPGQAIEMAVGKPVIQGLDKALSTSKEAQALEYTKLAETTTKTASEAKKVEDAKKVLDVAKVVTEKLPNNFLTRTIYGTLKSGVVHEIQGRVNDELKGFANFGVGSVNHLIGMPINTLGQVAIKMFGKESPLFVEKVIQAAQSGTAMTATMAGMTVVNAARETEDMSAFKDVLDQHFGTKEKALRFVAENFLLGLALHAVNANTVSGLFKSKYDEGYSKLSPEEKAKVDDFVKDTNEKANDFETATKDAVEQVQKDDHKPLTTDKEIEDGINEFKDAEKIPSLSVGDNKDGNKITRISEDGNDVFIQDKDGKVERYSPEEASKILGTNVLPENKVKTDESQIKPVEPTNAGQELNNGTGMAGSKQDAKIESAVIEIGGKIYEGKNHAEAILKAKADGQDISQVDRQAQGKFKLSDGTIIDRAESKSRFGQDRSELMIPQDENAKEANKEYAKITRKPLSKIAEKIKLDENKVTPIKPINTGQNNDNSGGLQQTPKDDNAIQQGNEQGKLSNQVEVPQVEQEKINPALSDVESTAKALEGKSSERLIPLFDVLGEVQNSEFNKQQAIDVINTEIEILPDDIRIAKDKERKEQLQQRLDYLADAKNKEKEVDDLFKELEKDSSERLLNSNKKVAEAYHKAKKDGSNPELVKAVESLLSKEQPTTQSEIEAKKADIGIGKVGNTEYEVKVDGVYYQGKKLNNPENKTHRQLIEADIERRRQEELKNSKIQIPRYFTFKELGGAKGKSGKTLSSIEGDRNEEIQQDFESKLQEGDKLIEPNGDIYYFKNGKVVKSNGQPRGMANIGAFISGVTIERADKINDDAELKALEQQLAEQQLAETEDVAREDQTVILDGLGVSKGTPQFQKSQEQHKEISQKNFETLIEKLKKPFANAFKNLNITTDLNDFNTKAEKQGIKPIEFTNKKGEVYGAKLPDGTIYINPEKLNANTPIHEFSHLWEQLMPNAWKKGLEIFKQTKTGKDLFEKLQKDGNYKNLSEEQLWSEAMNMLIGNLGESKYHSLPKGKLAEFVDWVKDTMAKFVNVVTGKSELNKEYDLKDFTNKVLGDLLGDKLLTPESVKAIDTTIQYAKDYGRKSDFNADGTVKESVRKEIEEERKTIVEKAKADGTYMKAPNGEKTKLNEEQWVTTRTERFKEWFGDWEIDPKNASKVIDDNGEPLVVYHGTNSEFTEFKQNNRSYGSGDTYGFLGNGFYFTNNFDTADSYSNYSGNVLPVFLNIKKPYISTNWEHTSPSRQGSFAKDLGVSVGEETTFLKGKNHDGVISTDEDYAEYLIYNPNQIKSATNNVGTFSNENNDIRFQVKDGLKEFVEDAKKEGYTKQETIDYVKDNNPEINEQDVIDTWDAVNEKAVDEKKENSEEENIGIKRRITDKRREELGLNAVTLPKIADNNSAMKVAKELVDSGDVNPMEIENELISNVENPAKAKASKEDVHIIQYRRLQLENKEKALLSNKIRLDEAIKSNPDDADAVAEYLINEENIKNNNADLDRNTTASRVMSNIFAGIGHGLQTEMNAAGEVQALIKKVRDSFGDNIPEDVKKRLDSLEQENKELKIKNEEIVKKYNNVIPKEEADKHIIEAYEKGKKDGSAGSQPKKYTQKFNRIADAFERKFKSKPLILRDADGNEIKLTQNSIVAWDDIIKIGAEAIRKTGEVIDGVNAIIEHIKDQDWYKNLSPNSKDAVKQQYEDYFTGKENKKKEDGLKVTSSRIKEIIERRKSENENTTVDDVVEEINRDFPDATPRQIRDAISGYGTIKEGSQEPIDKEVRKIKRMAKYDSILEDISNGVRPDKTGFQRDTLEVDELDQLKKIREGLKKLPLSDADLSKKLKTAQDAIETRLRNQIESLEKQIQTGEKSIRNTKVQTTPEIERLKIIRDEKKAILDEAESLNRHGDTLQELKDIADETGDTTITKKTVDDGLIKDLIQAHIEKGTPVEEIQKEIFDELKAIFPDTTERQVSDAITKQGQYKSEGNTLTELQQQISEIKKQANLKTKIEDTEKGIIAQTKVKGEKSKEVERLQQQLAELKKQALNKYADVSAADLVKKYEAVERQIKKGDYIKQKTTRRKFESDINWAKNNKRLTDIKIELNKLKDKALENNKNTFMKTLDIFDKWSTRMLFFGTYAYQLKLAATAASSIIHKPIEDIVGGLIYNSTLKNIAKNAPIEGNTKSSAVNLKDYYAELLRVDKWGKGILQLAYKGETSLDQQNNKYGHINFSLKFKGKTAGEIVRQTIGADHIPLIDLLTTDPHAMIKEPIKRATYKAAFNTYMDWVETNMGAEAVNDPLIIEVGKNVAFLKAKSEIFMGNAQTESGGIENQGFIDSLNGKISQLRNEAIKNAQSTYSNEKSKANADYAKASLAKFFAPIVKVPTNIIARAIKGNPVVLLRNIFKAIQINNDIEKGSAITNEHADAIIRDLKKGTVTSMYWFAGALLANSIVGGFWNPFYPDKKRKGKMPKINEMNLGQKKHGITDLMIHGAEHAPNVQAMMLGATFMQTLGYYNKNKKENLAYSFAVATAATANAIADQHPIYSTVSDLSQATQNEHGLDKFGNNIKRRFDIKKKFEDLNPADYYKGKMHPADSGSGSDSGSSRGSDSRGSTRGESSRGSNSRGTER